MNIVSNFIGSVSPEMFSDGVKSLTQNIDLGDTTFSDLLEKQINNLQKNEKDFMYGFGLPTDIAVGNAENVNTNLGVDLGVNDMSEAIRPINEQESSVFRDLSNPKNMSTSEVVTFFNSLFDSKPTIADTSDSGLFNFERKMAAGRYNQYARNIVTDINEFVTDTMKIKS